MQHITDTAEKKFVLDKFERRKVNKRHVLYCWNYCRIQWYIAKITCNGWHLL